jgi:hypothetical protein
VGATGNADPPIIEPLVTRIDMDRSASAVISSLALPHGAYSRLDDFSVERLDSAAMSAYSVVLFLQDLKLCELCEF